MILLIIISILYSLFLYRDFEHEFKNVNHNVLLKRFMEIVFTIVVLTIIISFIFPIGKISIMIIGCLNFIFIIYFTQKIEDASKL